jgi:hypothetical protein
VQQAAAAEVVGVVDDGLDAHGPAAFYVLPNSMIGTPVKRSLIAYDHH